MTKDDLFIISSAYKDLMCFTMAMVPGYILAPHNRLICEKLMDLESGKIKRLMINCPPRAGKSLLSSQLFPAWFLGRNPTKNVICSTYGQDLADLFGRAVRNTLQDERYQAVFPDSGISQDSASIKKFATVAGGMYTAVGVNGPLTGVGGDCFIGSTSVMTNVGARTIEQIHLSSFPIKALSYNLRKGAFEFKEIIASSKKEKKQVVRIKISIGDDIVCTPDHKIFVDEYGYKQAKDLKEGDKLLSCYMMSSTKYGVVRNRYVVSVTHEEEKQDVYDIQVASNNNFMANNILVHNCILIDDPTKNRADANSQLLRDKIKDWFKSTLYTRLSPDGRICIIQTRWHQDDLTGYLLSSEPDKWTVINIPAISDDGQSYWPERWPVEKLNAVKETIGSYEFASLYQQKPTPRESGMFQRHWFEVVDAVPANLTYVRGWDRAASVPKDGSDPDWTVGVKMGKSKDGIFYITDMVRLRGSSLDVQNAIKNTALRDGYTTKIVLEQDPGQAGKAEAEYLIRLLQGFNVKAVPVKKDKVTRAGPFSAQCEAGNVKLLRGIWNEAFLSELELFPNGLKDDIIDASTAGANYLMTPGLNYEGLTTL